LLTANLKQIIIPKFLKRWKEFAQNPNKIGKKDMTGIPLEESIRDFIRNEMEPFKVLIHKKGKKYPIWGDNNIIADVLIKKDGYPDSIISVKSWIGSGQLRETFAYGYLSKTWYGQKNIRVFMVTLHPLHQDTLRMMNICKPFIDGVFSLSEKPYFDDLIIKLKELYK
jgi:hypothetical protein